MAELQVAQYVMNPAEDEIRFGDELAEGMLILPEDPSARYQGVNQDDQLRGQRFRRITRIRPGHGGTLSSPPTVVIVAEWVDGYQEGWSGAVTCTWLVKKAAVRPAPGHDGQDQES